MKKIYSLVQLVFQDNLTADKKSAKEPEESQSLQMTDARFSRCREKKVGVGDIIHAGGSGSRDSYQLRCIACGNHAMPLEMKFLP
ncbi:hypothetical protein AAC387_Pa11g0295 [Persea americana]